MGHLHQELVVQPVASSSRQNWETSGAERRAGLAWVACSDLLATLLASLDHLATLLASSDLLATLLASLDLLATLLACPDPLANLT